MNTHSNKDADVIELNALAVEKGGRFYYSHRDERYRFVRGGRTTELHTFTFTSEARPWLTSLPAPVVYQGDGETLPGAVRRERAPRVKGVEPDYFLRTVTSRAFTSRYN